MECKVCNQKKNSTIMVLPQFSVYQCDFCGVEFTDVKNPSSLYQTEFFEHKGSYYTVDPIKIKKYYNGIINLLLNNHKKPRNLLDIGCGRGEFLSLACRYIKEVHALDVSKSVQKILENRFKHVTIGHIYSAKYKKEMFDTITALDLVEHLQNPQKFIKEVNRILSKNGIFVFKTPNKDSIYHSIAKLAYQAQRLKVTSLIYHKFHTFYYNLNSLEYLLSRNGFEIREIHYNNIIDHDTRFTGGRQMLLKGLGKLARALNKQHSIIVVAQKV